MKAAAVLLLSITGLCSGLQPGLEYQYRYSGRVGSGITDVRQQYAAAGIQADVTLQVTEDYSGTVQFSNVEVGDFHGDFDCDTRAPIPIEYNYIQKHLTSLQAPFKIQINETSKVIEYMEVSSEPLWITNIRKAIINIFRIVPFGVRGDPSEIVLQVPNFSVREETIIGRCTNWYNVAKLTEAEAARVNYVREQMIEIDAQRYDAASGSLTSKGAKGSKTSAKGTPKGTPKGTAKGHGKGAPTGKGTKTSQGQVPAERLTSGVPHIADTLWNVVRATAFEDCENYFVMKGHLTRQSEQLLARTSVGTYLIRGGVNGIRIESAVIEGSITVFTQEDHKEHYDTITNQTIELKFVRDIQEELRVTTQVSRIDSWQFETRKTDTNRVGKDTLEAILTDQVLSPAMVTEVKSIINTGIQELSDRMPRNPTYTTSLVEEMGRVVEAVSVLAYNQIEEIYNQYIRDFTEATSLNADNGSVEFQEKKIYIFKQSLIAAGTEPAITFLLSKMVNREFRDEDDETVSNFFNQIPNTIKSPSYIPKIMEVVKAMTWDDKEQDDKSVALITFSQLVNKMCLHSSRRSTYWYNTCEHACSPESVINAFIPYLHQHLEDDESPMWQRLIYLQSLSSLGTPHTIELLKPYILGIKETHLAFRKNAIWSLSRSNMHATAKVKVFQILMPIFWNKAEHHEVRSIAFLVMATWSDSLSWWQEMAAATWHEPSSKVANFISTTIRTAAHMDGGGELPKTARKVEHLTKPAAPVSITHSMNYYLLEYVYTNELGHPFIFAWLSNTDSIIPSEIYIRLRLASFLGFTHETKLNIQQFGFQNVLVKVFDTILAYQKKPDQEAVSIVTEMLGELQENIGFYPPNSDEIDKELYIKLQRVFKFIMTIPDDVIQRLDYTTILVHRPRFVNIPHYNRYIDAYAAIPTDLGLPFMIKHTAQNSWWLSTSQTRGLSKTIYEVKGSTSITLDASKMISVEAKVLIPWSDKFAIGTGSQRLVSLLFPFKVNHFLNIKNNELQLTLEPITNEKVHLIDATNTPFTVQYGSFPTMIHYLSEERKTIKKLDVCLYDRKTQVFPSYLGLRVESQWTGDVKFPLTFRRFYSGEVNFFTPTLKYWDYLVVYDPEASSTKSVTITPTYVSTDKTTGFGEGPGDLTSFGQETQGSDYTQFSQFSQSSSSDYQDFNELDAFTQEQNPTRQRIARLQEQIVPETGGHVRSVSVAFSLQGKSNLEYEGVLTWATGKSSTKRTTKFQITWIKGVPKGAIAQPHATCFSGQITKPYITPLLSVDEMLGTDLHATFKAEIHDGTSCEDPALLDIEGTMDVSQEGIEEAREKLTSEKCGQQHDFLPIDLITSPVYDHLTLKAQWTHDFPVLLKNFSHYAEDWLRGVAFPNIYYDYTVTNDDQVIEVDATKCFKSNKWTLHVSEPQENFILDELETPYLFNVITSPAAPLTTLYYDLLAGREHAVCILDQQRIRTLDGLVIPFTPDECWTVMTIDATGKGYGSLEVRYADGEWEVRVLFPKEGLMIELTKSQLKVNGEDHRTEDDRFHVTFLDDGALLSFPYVTTAMLKITENNVIFVEEQLFRSMIGGVCGNFDGEKSTEMIGPKGCVYTDPELFVKAWKTPAPGCTGFTYQAKKRPVDNYQDVCPHLTNVPTGVANPGTLKECSEWEYQERTEGNFEYKALIPTPRCKPGCRPSYLKSDPIMYDCQEQVQYGECNIRRFISSYPGDCIPQ